LLQKIKFVRDYLGMENHFRSGEGMEKMFTEKYFLNEDGSEKVT